MADKEPIPSPADPEKPKRAKRAGGLVMGQDTSADPVDGFEPIPLWMLGIFGMFLGWGGWYLGTYSAGWRWYELDEYSSTGAVATTQAAEDPIALGKRLFSGNCVSCHQANGQGLPGQYPPLNGSEWVTGNPAWMKRIILYGLEGEIEVKGARYNNAMPAFGAKLNDKQVAAVISFVRTNADWSNSASAVTPEQVAATRAATKGRSTPFSPSELKGITSDEGPAATSAPASGPASTPSTAPASAPATKPATKP